jgi:hypothetical protein
MHHLRMLEDKEAINVMVWYYTLYVYWNFISVSFYNYAPFEEEGVYCFANAGLSVCLSVRRSVGLSVCPSVDHMVSADYLEKYLSQSLHISHSDWSSLVDDPY